MWTTVPVPPLTGKKELTTGTGGIYVNPGSVTVPEGALIVTLPVAPEPTTAVIVVGDTTEKEAAGIPPKLTPVVPVKLLPVIVTVAPDLAEAGVKLAVWACVVSG